MPGWYQGKNKMSCYALYYEENKYYPLLVKVTGSVFEGTFSSFTIICAIYEPGLGQSQPARPQRVLDWGTNVSLTMCLSQF